MHGSQPNVIHKQHILSLSFPLQINRENEYRSFQSDIGNEKAGRVHTISRPAHHPYVRQKQQEMSRS